MSTRPQQQISCKKHASVDRPLCVSTPGGLLGVPAATLCRGIVRPSTNGTIRKDSATRLNPLFARVGEAYLRALIECYASHKT